MLLGFAVSSCSLREFCLPTLSISRVGVVPPPPPLPRSCSCRALSRLEGGAYVWTHATACRTAHGFFFSLSLAFLFFLPVLLSFFLSFSLSLFLSFFLSLFLSFFSVLSVLIISLTNTLANTACSCSCSVSFVGQQAPEAATCNSSGHGWDGRPTDRPDSGPTGGRTTSVVRQSGLHIRLE